MQVTLFASNPRLIKLVRECVSPLDVEVLSQPPRVDDYRVKVNFVVTLGKPSKDMEYYAMMLGTYPVVLPEASRWLCEKVKSGRNILASWPIEKNAGLV